MSEWSDAFAEVVRAVQPDVDPVLTKGDGVTADATKELDAILISCLRGTTWANGATVTYGQTILPATRMGRKFKVKTAGILGSTEPSWPDYDYGSVTSGTATLVEDGRDFDNAYDLRRAKYLCCEMKETKASDRINSSADGASYSEHQTPQYWKERKREYRSVGVG